MATDNSRSPSPVVPPAPEDFDSLFDGLDDEGGDGRGAKHGTTHEIIKTQRLGCCPWHLGHHGVAACILQPKYA